VKYFWQRLETAQFDHFVYDYNSSTWPTTPPTTTTTTTVRQIPNQILTGNKCYCPGLAAVPGLGNGSRCDTYGGGADNNNNILALNQRLLR